MPFVSCLTLGLPVVSPSPKGKPLLVRVSICSTYPGGVTTSLGCSTTPSQTCQQDAALTNKALLVRLPPRLTFMFLSRPCVEALHHLAVDIDNLTIASSEGLSQHVV